MSASKTENQQAVATWLFVCTAFIAVMVVIGGATRLTGSGLSITEWNLVMGTIPPLNEGQWGEVFDQYKKSPEYKLVNTGMTMSEFKSIFWWEYVHRLVGRTVGFVFLLPYLYFAIRRRITKAQGAKLFILFLLGGAQGVLGWYMVKSGLVKDPQVSHFRLTAHLTLAFLLFGATLWQGLQFKTAQFSNGGHQKKGQKKGGQNKALAVSVALMALVMLQVALGAMVAGLKAGYMFNTFPKMGDHWIPPGMGYHFLMNGIAIQFCHRVTAYLVLLAVVLFWWKSRKTAATHRQKNGYDFILLVVLIQFVLGVFTLLFYVPVMLGVLHQFGALILFGGTVFLSHSLWLGSRSNP